MFIDASALVAILVREDEADDLTAQLDRTTVRITSPLAVWETAVAISRGLGLTIADATFALDAYLQEVEIELRPVTPDIANLALQAFDHYGKGRHPAKLNMGDCFAYACAKHMRQPLLYKGDDFALTDIEAVLK